MTNDITFVSSCYSINFMLSYFFFLPAQGVVLAVNARVLAKNCSSMETILNKIPGTQLLVWTGTGEPPISQRKIDYIKHYFDRNGLGDRVGFDCKVRGHHRYFAADACHNIDFSFFCFRTHLVIYDERIH